MNVRKLSSILLVGLTIAMLVGCARSTIKIGWSGTSRPGVKAYSYTTFNGREKSTFRAEEGEMIVLDYEVTVDKGSLTLRVENPDGESLWEESFEEDGEDSVEISVDTSGRHQIVIVGNDTGGSFDLSWEIEE